MRHLKNFNENVYINGKLPSLEEVWIKNTGNKPNSEEYSAMVEFAKIHVKEALRVAAYSAEIVYCGNPYDVDDDSKCVDEKSILNAYPENNIK